MSHQQEHTNVLQERLARIFESQIRSWNGNARLSKVFWRDGVLTSSILILLYAVTINTQHLVAEQFLLVLFGFYTIWILVSIWRCSAAVDTFWSLLARFLTIAWAANVAFVLLFRQLELLVLFTNITV